MRRETGPFAKYRLIAARALTLAAVFSLGISILAGCGSDKRQVKLMYAGSLIVPFERLAAEFERAHPDVDVVTESHGSIRCCDTSPSWATAWTSSPAPTSSSFRR